MQIFLLSIIFILICVLVYQGREIRDLERKTLDAFKIVFSCATQFDTSASGRTTAKIEKRTREEMEHLTYNGRRINQYGGIIIEDTTYTLNVSLNDSKILDIDRPCDVIISINLEGIINYE